MITISKDSEIRNMQLDGTKEPSTNGTTKANKNETSKAIPTMPYLFATIHSEVSLMKNWRKELLGTKKC